MNFIKEDPIKALKLIQKPLENKLPTKLEKTQFKTKGLRSYDRKNLNLVSYDDNIDRVSYDDGSDKKSYDDSGTNQVDPKTGGDYLAGLARPALNGLTYLNQRSLIKRQADAQRKRQMHYLVAPQANVLPVQDMPVEVLNQRLNQIDRVRSQYKGSDPIKEMIMKQMAAAHRGSLQDDLGAQRATHLLQERQRVAQEEAANQLRVGETGNRNIERLQNQTDYMVDVDVNEKQNLRNLNAQFLSQMGKNMDERAMYNTKRALVQRQNYINSLERKVAEAQRRRELLDTDDFAGIDKYNKQIDALNEKIMQYSNTKLPSRFDVDSIGLTGRLFKSGGKLIPRK